MAYCPTIAPYLVTAATHEPVLLSEAKKQVELATQDTAHDNHLTLLLAAARQQFEHDTGITCIDSRWAFTMDEFPSGEYFELHKRPVTSMVSIVYVDTAGSNQTLATSVYGLDANRVMPIVHLKYQQDWPAIQDQFNAVTVTFQAGYSSSATVPQRIKQAILLLVTHWFEQRTPVNVGNIVNEVPLAYTSLIQSLMRPNYP